MKVKSVNKTPDGVYTVEVEMSNGGRKIVGIPPVPEGKTEKQHLDAELQKLADADKLPTKVTGYDDKEFLPK